MSTKTNKSKKKPLKNQFVKNTAQLKRLIEEGCHTYAIVLAGGIGVYSKKTISYNKDLKKFKIINHIDDTEQYLSDKELLDHKITNIGKAMPLNCLVAIIN